MKKWVGRLQEIHSQLLNRNILIKKTMFQTKTLGEMFAQRLHAVAFSCMMTGRKEDDASLVRHVHVLPGNFSASIHISLAQRSGVCAHPLLVHFAHTGFQQAFNERNLQQHTVT